MFSMAMSVTKMLSVTSDRKLVDILESGKKIAVIFYDFDGVLSTEKQRYFEHWTEHDVSTLQPANLRNLFGNEERIAQLRGHLSRCSQKGVKLVLYGLETKAKMQMIVEKLSLFSYFTEIIGSDHPIIRDEAESHNRIQILLLQWMKANNVDNGELLYVSAVEENTRLFANNGTCHTYDPGSLDQKQLTQNMNVDGITKRDFEVIEQTI